MRYSSLDNALSDMKGNPWSERLGGSSAQRDYWLQWITQSDGVELKKLYPGTFFEQKAEVDAIVAEANAQEDVVNHPSHYQSGGLEAIQVLMAFDLNRDGRLFNVGKYVLRAGKKGDSELQDLKKARWYLNHYIAEREGGE